MGGGFVRGYEGKEAKEERRNVEAHVEVEYIYMCSMSEKFSIPLRFWLEY